MCDTAFTVTFYMPVVVTTDQNFAKVWYTVFSAMCSNLVAKIFKID